MTMPHLMNCIHSGDGWCPACVAELGNSREELLSALHKALPYVEGFMRAQAYRANTLPDTEDKARAVIDLGRAAIAKATGEQA